MNKFDRVTVDQYLEYIKSIYNPSKRQIKELHRHHCWKPDYTTWKNAKDKKQVIVSMEIYHKSLGWSEIGQHATLDPEGYIWICRDIAKAPASITGRNTNAWAVEMIGNFDIGMNKMTSEQSEAMIKLFNGMQKITGAIIVDHNQYSEKTCPGTGLSKKELLDAIKQLNNVHWAEKHYNSLILKGLKINEKRYDDALKRSELFALLDQLTN